MGVGLKPERNRCCFQQKGLSAEFVLALKWICDATIANWRNVPPTAETERIRTLGARVSIVLRLDPRLFVMAACFLVVPLKCFFVMNEPIKKLDFCER